jgi:hypothetical protein
MTDNSFLLLKAAQLSANRLAYELRASIRAGDCVDFFKGLDREADKDRFNLHWRATHQNNPLKSDIAY